MTNRMHQPRSRYTRHIHHATVAALLLMCFGAQAQTAVLSGPDKSRDDIYQAYVDLNITDLFFPIFNPKYLNARGDVTPRPDAYSPEFGDPDYYNTYYGTVDPLGERETLDEWLEVNGFLDYAHLVEHAEYINASDLGFGREMYCLDNGRTSCYVKNYLDPEGESAFAATVTMERMNSGSDSFVAFFVYDADGNRINQIALDSEGQKSVPESCYACHGGYSHFGNPHGGQYLPFDIDALKDWPGHPTRANQLEDFRGLNRIIWSDATYYGPKESLVDLIEGWYGGAPYAGTEYDESHFPPDSWFTAPNALVPPASSEDVHRYNVEKFLYTDVYANYCRLCHVAQDLDWQDAHAGDFARAAYNHICEAGSNEPRMPHAEVTYDKFNNDAVHTLDGSGSLSLVGNLKLPFLSQPAASGLRYAAPARLARRTAVSSQIDTSRIQGFRSIGGETARHMLCEALPISFPMGIADNGTTNDGESKFNTCSGCHWFENADADYFGKPGGSLRCRGAWVRQDLGTINTLMNGLTLSFQDMQDLHAYLNAPQECQ